MANHRVPWRQAQRVCGNLKLVLAVGARRRDHRLKFGLLRGQRIKVGVGFGVGGVHLVESLTRGIDLAQRLLHAGAHRGLGLQRRLLWQVANFDPRHGGGLALDFGVHTRHDAQQRGFARAVQAQHTDLGPREKRQRNVFENEFFGWDDLAHPVHGVNVLSHSRIMTCRPLHGTAWISCDNLDLLHAPVLAASAATLRDAPIYPASHLVIILFQ